MTLNPSIFLASLLLLSACAGTGKKTEENNARLQQLPEVNKVEVITLQRADFSRQVLSNGKLSAAAKACLAFRSGGTLQTVNVRNGQRVKAGDVLAKVSREDLALAVESARIALQKAEMDLYDYLVGQGYPARDTSSIPGDLLAMAKMRSGYSVARNALARAEFDLNGTVLKAPFSGRVADIRLRRYDLAGSDSFCTLVDDSAFDVDFSIMESEYGFVREGLSVKVTPFAGDAQVYMGQITAVSPTVDCYGQIMVRARIKGSAGLIDGMNVRICVEQKMPGQLVVPRSAVVIRDNLDVLFTYSDDGKAHWIYVNILASNGESHVVEANTDRGAQLLEGDRVIVSGNLNLADGSSVTLK